MSKSLIIPVLNAFTLDLDAHSDSHGFATEGPSMTVQSDLESSDINNIVKMFGVTKELPYGALTPFYDDITDFPTDFHEAQNFVIASQEAFMTLPAAMRSEFNNDAGAFLDFINDPANYDSAIERGLVPPRPVVEDVLPETPDEGQQA